MAQQRQEPIYQGAFSDVDGQKRLAEYRLAIADRRQPASPSPVLYKKALSCTIRLLRVPAARGYNGPKPMSEPLIDGSVFAGERPACLPARLSAPVS